VLSKCTSNSYVYLSIDLDCIDSGIAPGVSVPSFCGLMPMELLFLIKKVCTNLRIVGLDIVELSPDYDLNHNTASIGARLLMEAIASISITKRKS
jgi:agmatinase